MKEKDKITAKELNDTEIISMSDREFKVITIKIHTELEKKKWSISVRPLIKRYKIKKKEPIRDELNSWI